jgi:hypothetical protein
MTPEQKFHSYVTSATVFLMYLVVELLLPFLDKIGNDSVYVKPIISALSAIGMYTLLAVILNVLSRRSISLKKHLLGSSFLNGTWVGKFVNTRGEVKITVEIFEQTISSLVIRGDAFNEDGTSYASWVSTSSTINSNDGVLTYTYTCDSFMDYSVFQGIGVFKFERKGEYLPPTYIKGYSVDITDGVKTENREKKISDSLYELHEAYLIAKNNI